MDISKMNRPEYPETGEFCQVCTTIHDAGEILHTADRIPDETTKEPLIEGANIVTTHILPIP